GGTDVRDSRGDTPLKLASMSGHFLVVKLLICRGGRVDVADNDGHTAPYGAVTYGHERTAENLLERSNAETELGDATEILLEAAKRGFARVCELCIDGLRMDRDRINVHDDNGWTAL